MQGNEKIEEINQLLEDGAPQWFENVMMLNQISANLMPLGCLYSTDVYCAEMSRGILIVSGLLGSVLSYAQVLPGIPMLLSTQAKTLGLIAQNSALSAGGGGGGGKSAIGSTIDGLGTVTSIFEMSGRVAESTMFDKLSKTFNVVAKGATFLTAASPVLAIAGIGASVVGGFMQNEKNKKIQEAQELRVGAASNMSKEIDAQIKLASQYSYQQPVSAGSLIANEEAAQMAAAQAGETINQSVNVNVGGIVIEAGNMDVDKIYVEIAERLTQEVEKAIAVTPSGIYN